jgi:hypothetical protein
VGQGCAGLVVLVGGTLDVAGVGVGVPTGGELGAVLVAVVGVAGVPLGLLGGKLVGADPVGDGADVLDRAVVAGAGAGW